MSTSTPNPREAMLQSLSVTERALFKALRDPAIDAVQRRGFRCISNGIDTAKFACGNFITTINIYPKSQPPYVVTFATVAEPEKTISLHYADTPEDILVKVEQQVSVGKVMKETHLKIHDPIVGGVDNLVA